MGSAVSVLLFGSIVVLAAALIGMFRPDLVDVGGRG
jgi:hypothetical protein